MHCIDDEVRYRVIGRMKKQSAPFCMPQETIDKVKDMLGVAIEHIVAVH